MARDLSARTHDISHTTIVLYTGLPSLLCGVRALPASPSRASHQEAAERPCLGHDEAQHKDSVDAEEVHGVALGRRVAAQREDHLRGCEGAEGGARRGRWFKGMQGSCLRGAHVRAISPSHKLTFLTLSYCITLSPHARRGRGPERSRQRGSSG